MMFNDTAFSSAFFSVVTILLSIEFHTYGKRIVIQKYDDMVRTDKFLDALEKLAYKQHWAM